MEGRRAGGSCFQMEKVNFRPAGGLLHTRQKGWSAGCTKKAVRRAAEKGGTGCRKGQPSGPSFSAAQLNVQLTCPSCGAACRPALLCSSPVLFRIRIFGVRSCGTMRYFWIRNRIGYHFCSSRIRIIQNVLNTF